MADSTGELRSILVASVSPYTARSTVRNDQAAFAEFAHRLRELAVASDVYVYKGRSGPPVSLESQIGDASIHLTNRRGDDLAIWAAGRTLLGGTNRHGSVSVMYPANKEGSAEAAKWFTEELATGYFVDSYLEPSAGKPDLTVTG